MCEVSLEFLGPQMLETRDDLTVVIGVLRGLNGRVDGLQEEVRGLRHELAAFHRRESRRAQSSEEVDTRLTAIEERLEGLERAAH